MTRTDLKFGIDLGGTKHKKHPPASATGRKPA
jgi:hypothetical protein